MKKTVWVLLAFLLAIHTSYGQKEVQFKFNPKTGKPLQMKLFSETETSGAQEMIMEMEMGMQYLPKEEKDGVFTIESAIEDIKVNMMVGMQTITYDSKEEPKDEMSKMIGAQFAQLIDQKIITYINGEGKTIDVEFSGSENSPMDISSMTKNLSAAFPNHPVKPGDSWTQDLAADELDGASFAITYTYKEENEEGYVVDLEGEMKDESGNSAGSMEGYYILDKGTHVTKKSEMKMNMSNMGMEIKNNVTMTLE